MAKNHYLHRSINTLHGQYLRFKHFAPAVFFVFIVIALTGTNLVYGQNIVAIVKTPLAVDTGEDTINFVTTQNTIRSALVQGGIFLGENDATEPPLETVLNGQKTKVTLKKALPVLISDNNQEFLAFSGYDDPQEILKQLDMKVYPEDRIKNDLILDPAEEGAAGQKITIERAPVYNVYVDGKKITVRSWEGTVKDVLAGNVSLGLRDIVEPALGSKVSGGNIRVTRINVVEITEMETVEYQIQYRDDYYLPQGADKLIQAGSNGSRKNLVRIRYRNGEIESKTVLSSTTLKPAVTKIVTRGMMPSGHRDFNATYWSYMVQAGTKYGISPLDLYRVAVCESHVNPYSRGAYYGMYQYNLGFWSSASAAAGFAGAPWSDAKAQIFSTAKYASENGWGKWGCKP